MAGRVGDAAQYAVAGAAEAGTAVMGGAIIGKVVPEAAGAIRKAVEKIKGTAAGEGNAAANAAEAAVAGKGVNNPTTKAAVDTGNRVHYDSLNGSTGSELPTAISEQYPDTEFAFAKRGTKGPDVTVTGGTHPSAYPESTWPSGSNVGDFKPNTASGLKTFKRDIRTGKLPEGTVRIPYDPKTGRLEK